MSNQVYNPITNRFVQYRGRIHKKLIQDGILDIHGNQIEKVQKKKVQKKKVEDVDDFEKLLDSLMKPKKKKKFVSNVQNQNNEDELSVTEDEEEDEELIDPED